MLSDKILLGEFDYNMLIYALSEYKHPREKINRLLKKREIIRVKKGLYVFGEEQARKPFFKETLANLIYGPSYISLEYALSYYGLIPERPVTITCITSKKNKVFSTPIGIFTYRYIHPGKYAVGVTIEQLDDQHQMIIATREKAVADILYYAPGIDDNLSLERFLIDDLRIEKSELMQLDKALLRIIARCSKNKNVSLLSSLIGSY